MKKIVSILMAVVMLLTVMTTAVTAYGAENDSLASGYGPTNGTTGSLSWYISSNTLHINGSGDMLNYTSTTMPWYGSKYDIKSIVIADTVTSIGDYAFYYCSSLTSISMGKGIKKIGSKALYSCSNLTSLTIPDTVTEIGNDAFSYCSKISSITSNCPAKIGEYAFQSSSVLESVSLPKAKSVSRFAFSSCPNLKTANLGNATLESYAFGHTTNALSSVTAGTLKNYALNGVSSIQTLNIKNASSIGENAVYGCSNIKSITSNAKTVGAYAFRYCTSLQTVNLPKATTIGKYAFYDDKNIKTVKFGKISTINEYAFTNCEALQTVTGTGNLKKVMDGAFAMDSKIKKFGSPKKLTYVGDSAFGNCKNMTGSFGFSKVTYVGSMAFVNCQKLSSTLNFTKVKSIGSKAFLNCKSIKGNTTGTKVTKIDSNAFVGCSKINSLYIPSCCKSIGYEAFAKKITSISVSSSGYVSATYDTYGPKIKLYGNKGSVAQSYAKSYKSGFYYAVQKVAVNKTSVTVKAKGSAKISVKSITPYNAKNKKVSFTTSNKKIATVSSTGVVKGVKKGSCYVYCKSTDGSLKSAKVKVTVK